MQHPIYAIGDIHGQLDMLDAALLRIDADGGHDAQIVFLGDYTDRGPDSRGVLDRLIEGQQQGRNWTFLMGNHDRMFRWFMMDFPRHDAYLPVELYWLHPRLGGDTTLASYGIPVRSTDRKIHIHARALEIVPQAHMEFLRGLALSHETNDLFFAHAGIRPNVPLGNQTEHDLLWIRGEFHDDQSQHPKLIVHGHTPVQEPTHYGNRVNLDSGAGYGRPLTAAVFEGAECWVLTDDGRKPLLPES